MKRTPLNRVGKVKARTLTAEAAFRRQVQDNARGLCQGFTPDCPPHQHAGHHAHHCAIADRRRGIHDPQRGLFLCLSAHTYIHANPAESYERGWLLRSGS